MIGELGPFVAIGRPGERVSPTGAARLYVSDSQWKSTVTNLIGKAQLVIWQAGDTENTWWELQEFIRLSNPFRLIMYIPNPQSNHLAFEAVRRRAAEVLPIPLPEFIGSASAVIFDQQWRPQMTSLKSAVETVEKELPASSVAPTVRPAKRWKLRPVLGWLVIIVLMGARTFAPGSRYALHKGIEKGDLLAIDRTLNWREPPLFVRGETLPDRALRAGWKAFAVIVSDNSADVNEANSKGRTPLFDAVVRDQVDVAALLVRHGADVNHASSAGTTPLQSAALDNGDVRLGALLIDHGADVNARDTGGRTPLHYAAMEGHRAFMTFLYSRGARDIRDRNDRTAEWIFAHLTSDQKLPTSLGAPDKNAR